MATQPRIAMKAIRNVYGMGLPKENVPETASVTFKKGALVLSTSGFLTECGADPAKILGCATRDGQNGGSNGTYSQEVEIALPGVLFLGNLSNTGDTAVTATTDRWANYGVLKDATSGKWMVDKDETTNDRVTVWQFFLQDKDAIGDTRGRVYFMFDPLYCQALAVD